MRKKTRKSIKAVEKVVKKPLEDVSVYSTAEPVKAPKVAPTTKMLVYNKMPLNKFTTFKYAEYVFKFDTNLDPVPVKVPSDIADILLQMVDADCTCHHTTGEPIKLFREV
jgi:hypothetical protein